jgi:hypothetical protein
VAAAAAAAGSFLLEKLNNNAKRVLVTPNDVREPILKPQIHQKCHSELSEESRIFN